MELTVVLQGAFRECEDRFGVGDPEIAGAGADCICLTATDAPFRFKEWVLRMFFRI